MTEDRMREIAHEVFLEELPQWLALHGITAEKPSRPVLTGEGERDPDEREDTVLTVEELRGGTPLGPPLDAHQRPALTQSLLPPGVFDAFDRGGQPSGTLDQSAQEALGDLLTEALRGRQHTEPDDEPSTHPDGALQPHEYAGVRVARGF
jgi:hypothetical protein